MSRLPAGVLREATIDVGAITANVRHLRRLTGAEEPNASYCLLIGIGLRAPFSSLKMLRLEKEIRA